MVCNLKCGVKEIPVYFYNYKIEERLLETSMLIDLFLRYLKLHSIQITDKQKKLLYAEESISSCYIEGYESYLTPYFLLEEVIAKSTADKAVRANYKAYIDSFNILDDVNNIEDILYLWKIVIKYKKLFRKNIRKSGVVVGNRKGISHKAPSAKYVKSLMNEMFESLSNIEIKGDKYCLLDGIIFHYLYTFIHPFLDGNGRSARLVQNLKITKLSNLPFIFLISNVILRDKQSYYSVFKSGQKFGDNSLDIISIDISDFINYNLYTISQGLIESMRSLKLTFDYDVFLPEIEDVLFCMNSVGLFKREGIKDIINNLEYYCKLLLIGSVEETRYGVLRLHFKDVSKFLECIEKVRV